MKFIWDTQKSEDNKKKHGLSFDTAKFVFGDPFRAVFFDDIHSDDEDRFIVIGFVQDVALLVICTERDDEIRIISARKAMHYEVDKYYFGNV